MRGALQPSDAFFCSPLKPEVPTKAAFWSETGRAHHQRSWQTDSVPPASPKPLNYSTIPVIHWHPFPSFVCEFPKKDRLPVSARGALTWAKGSLAYLLLCFIMLGVFPGNPSAVVCTVGGLNWCFDWGNVKPQAPNHPNQTHSLSSWTAVTFWVWTMLVANAKSSWTERACKRQMQKVPGRKDCSGKWKKLYKTFLVAKSTESRGKLI